MWSRLSGNPWSHPVSFPTRNREGMGKQEADGCFTARRISEFASLNCNLQIALLEPISCSQIQFVEPRTPRVQEPSEVISLDHLSICRSEIDRSRERRGLTRGHTGYLKTQEPGGPLNLIIMLLQSCVCVSGSRWGEWKEPDLPLP